MKVLLTMIFALTLIGCNSAVDKKQPVSTAAQNSSPSPPAAPANLPANQNATSPPNPNYATNTICSVPKEIAPDTPFAKLGGGKWEKWGSSNGYLSYGCKDTKNLSNSVDVTSGVNLYIGFKYDALGEAQAVHNVATEYTAGQTPTIVPDEKKYREQYADFCDKLSSKFYGLKLPDTFKKKLLDEANYSPYETDIKYGEKVGTGYVMVSSEISKEKDLIRLKVYFYSNETDYNKYK